MFNITTVGSQQRCAQALLGWRQSNEFGSSKMTFEPWHLCQTSPIYFLRGDTYNLKASFLLLQVNGLHTYTTDVTLGAKEQG